MGEQTLRPKTTEPLLVFPFECLTPFMKSGGCDPQRRRIFERSFTGAVESHTPFIEYVTAKSSLVLPLVYSVRCPPAIVKVNGLLVGENHFRNSMDVRARDEPSCVGQKSVIQLDHFVKISLIGHRWITPGCCR